MVGGRREKGAERREERGKKKEKKGKRRKKERKKRVGKEEKKKLAVRYKCQKKITVIMGIVITPYLCIANPNQK